MSAQDDPNSPHVSWLTAAIAGVIFAVGLVLSGMTQPAKVVGFLDVFGSWDPSLAFVMGGAVIVHALSRLWIMKRAKPLCAPSFQEPSNPRIDSRLVAGAILFGAGWGLVGICPGPGLVALGSGSMLFGIFVACMLVGMWLEKLLVPAIATNDASGKSE